MFDVVFDNCPNIHMLSSWKQYLPSPNQLVSLKVITADNIPHIFTNIVSVLKQKLTALSKGTQNTKQLLEEGLRKK